MGCCTCFSTATLQGTGQERSDTRHVDDVKSDIGLAKNPSQKNFKDKRAELPHIHMKCSASNTFTSLPTSLTETYTITPNCFTAWCYPLNSKAVTEGKVIQYNP